jgi:branched-chain amino acid transport system substrate-binding protein
MRTRTVLRSVAVAAAIVTAGAALAACTPDTPETPSDTLVIGTSLPLTGDFSQGGQDTQQGYEVWQAIVNESGGLLGQQVEFKILDDASDQNTIVSDYNQLIGEDKVDFVLGSQSSRLNIPASAVAEEAGYVYICPSCGSPDMFNRGFQNIFFSQQAVAAEQGNAFAEYILGLPEGERPSTAAYPSLDDPFSGPVAQGIREKLEAGGIETVYNEFYPEDLTNFDQIAAAVKASGAELVVQGAQFQDGVNFVQSLNRAGYQPAFLYQSSSPTYGQSYLDGVGQENAEGVFFSSSYTSYADTPGNAEFLEKYHEMFGEQEPPEDAADGYAAAQVLQAAVEAVGSTDQAAIVEWLHENEVQTILGPLSWNEDGSPIGTFLIGQWQGGTQQIVFPVEFATTDTIVPNWRG